MNALLLLTLLGKSPFIVPPPNNLVPGEARFLEGFEATGDFDTACAGPSKRFDIEGEPACPYTTDTAPAGTIMHTMDNFGAGTQTAGNVVIRGGIDEHQIAIDAFGSCNAADTITATIGLGSAAGAACTCTYGTNWCTGSCGTDDLTAASLAACLDACTGIDSTSTTDPATLQIDPTEGMVRSVVLTESDGACSTVANGANGDVVIGGGGASAQVLITPGTSSCTSPDLSFLGGTTDGVYWAGAGDLRYCGSGAQIASMTSSFLVTVGGMRATGFQTAASEYFVLGTNPTIASGFGTSPAILATNTAAFRITIGTGGTESTGVITMPAATTGWSCTFADVTTPASFVTDQSAYTTTSVTAVNYSRTLGTAIAWTAGDVLAVMCMGF